MDAEQHLRGLLEDTVNFWFPRAVDREQGGFFHCLNRDGSLVDSDKSVWAQGRMSWMLLELYNRLEPRPEWLEWAGLGLDFIQRHCFDGDGRMFFHVTRNGRPIRKRRYAFSESFAAIAFAAHARATGRRESGERAMQLFRSFVDWHFTEGRIPAKFTDTRPMIGLGPRMIALVTAQELRENLGEQPILAEWIDRCLEEIINLFVKPDIKCVMENVGPQGEIIDHFDGRILNPGHAIEAAWFVMREGRVRADGNLVETGCKMLDWMWERGWDKEYGGILYFRDVFNHPVQEYWHDMKFWWGQNEAVIASLMAARLTGRDKFKRMYDLACAWSHRHFADPLHGEWYACLHRDGSVSIPLKGTLWKSFFHHPRMQLMAWELLQPDWH